MKKVITQLAKTCLLREYKIFHVRLQEGIFTLTTTDSNRLQIYEVAFESDIDYDFIIDYTTIKNCSTIEQMLNKKDKALNKTFPNAAGVLNKLDQPCSSAIVECKELLPIFKAIKSNYKQSELSDLPVTFDLENQVLYFDYSKEGKVFEGIIELDTCNHTGTTKHQRNTDFDIRACNFNLFPLKGEITILQHENIIEFTHNHIRTIIQKKRR